MGSASSSSSGFDSRCSLLLPLRINTIMSAQELVFSTVNGLELKMDVTLPSTATADKPCPALLWWHGGGLLQGSRKSKQLAVPPLLASELTFALQRLGLTCRLHPRSTDWPSSRQTID